MTHGSEKRAVQSAPRKHTAEILPFERPQNEAQRSIRRRVQERLDRESEQRKKPKTSPARVAITIAIALIPVMLTVAASDYLIRKVKLITSLYSRPTPQAPATPAENELRSNTPGVLLIMKDPNVTTEGEPPAETSEPASAAPQTPAAQQEQE